MSLNIGINMDKMGIHLPIIRAINYRFSGSPDRL